MHPRFVVRFPVSLVVSLLLTSAISCNKPQSTVSPGSAPTAAATAPQTLKVEDLKLGEGAEATTGKLVAIHYTGWTSDGNKFDSTLTRKPLQFQLGQGSVLKGWEEGISGMKVGGKRKLVVPPALAFGKREVGQIKPDSTLVFEVELVSVQ